MSGGKKKDGTGSREVVPGWSMLRCSAGRELTLTGDAFSARKSILRGGRKTLVYVKIFQRSAGWCTQPAFTYTRSSIVAPWKARTIRVEESSHCRRQCKGGGATSTRGLCVEDNS
jgi:hypothetical protein